MERIEGLYTAITAIIKEKESEFRLAISTNDIVNRLKNEIDIETVPKEVLADYVLRFAAAVGLNDNGYRSVIRGNGLYIKLENCEKSEYLNRLYNNAFLSEKQKEQIVNLIKKQREIAGIAGQTSFDLDTGMIIEDVTEEQLLELLKRDAGVA